MVDLAIINLLLKPEMNIIPYKLSCAGHNLIPSQRKKAFIVLFFTIFIIVTGMGMVVPLLPIYAENLGANGLYIGMIFGSFAFSRTIFLPYFGKLSDRNGRKPFILAGLAGYVLVAIAFVWFANINSLILIRFIQGIASAMIMPVVQAYIGEITELGREGYSMGLFSMSMFASLSLGPLMGGMIKDAWSIQGTFICMAVLSAAGLLLSTIFLPSVAQEHIKRENREAVPWKIIIKGNKSLFAIFSFRFAYTSCIGVIWCFLPVFADRQFHLSGSFTGLLVMLGVFVSGLLQLPMGYVADRYNKRIMVCIGGLICSAGMLMLTNSHSYFDLLFAVCLFGLGGGISMPAVMAIAVLMGNEKKAMASIMSIITMAHSMGMMAGAITAGIAMDYFNLRFAFPCGMIIMITGTFLFLIFIGKL